MLLRLLFLAGVIFTASLSAQTLASGDLAGRIDKGVYYSPSNAYSIRIPVLPQLGGQVRDNENVVTFQDQFTVHVSIACFAQDATQRWELSTRGANDYLVFFLNNYVMPDFLQASPATRIESIVPTASIEGGALIAYILLPGGSMFTERASISLDGSVPAAKRGNLLFVKNGFIYVISMELAERVQEGSSYKLKRNDEDRVLKERLEAILDRMTFATPAKSAEK